jgi:thiosulfate/3-mercaptopyruvate sulfurtransferase
MLLSLLITTKDLFDLIGKPEHNAIVIDTRSFSEYKKGHIPGAINIDLFQLHWFDTSKRGITDFNRQTRMVLSNIGIQKSSCVIFYDNVSGMTSARGVWLMLYFSHRKVQMLDGGLQEWKKAGYPIEIKSNPLGHCKLRGKVDNNIISTAEEVKKSLNKKNVVVLDARTKEEYNGSVVRAARRGHIPSAVNIDWENNIENSVFKTKERLSKIYSKIPKNRKIITYCQGGFRAANTFLALKMLGYNSVKMYLGSWAEWGNRIEFPVQEGD